MRVLLSAWGWDILDIRIHALRRSQGDSEQIVVSTPLEDSERSEPMEPDTIAFGFH